MEGLQRASLRIHSIEPLCAATELPEEHRSIVCGDAAAGRTWKVYNGHPCVSTAARQEVSE
ncbi:hypothetical protein E2C01_052359 [Portunus trituberculatus]|uniref:Uncharacterized protein n=1 Tax=Portunus trituberculatus TaxID=210409 RepID=A0A5B7GM92_PORTR|nr:hypothetical protein [Portunus trituberculatus]